MAIVVLALRFGVVGVKALSGLGIRG